MKIRELSNPQDRKEVIGLMTDAAVASIIENAEYRTRHGLPPEVPLSLDEIIALQPVLEQALNYFPEVKRVAERPQEYNDQMTTAWNKVDNIFLTLVCSDEAEMVETILENTPYCGIGIDTVEKLKQLPNYDMIMKENFVAQIRDTTFLVVMCCADYLDDYAK